MAGQVLGPAFPGALGFLAPRFFSLGLIAAAFTTLISVSLTMTYFCLDMARQELALHRRQHSRSRSCSRTWIAIPALVAPFWQLPALLKAILAMVGNLVLAPVAVAVILYFVNRPALGRVPRQRRPQHRPRRSRRSLRSRWSSTACGGCCDDRRWPRRRRAARSKQAGVVAVIRLTDASRSCAPSRTRCSRAACARSKSR